MDEAKGTAFVVLGVVSVIAVVGIVLLLTDSGATGQAVTMAGCDSPSTPVRGLPDENSAFLKRFVAAGFSCEKAPGTDVYGKETWCCTPPQGVPVNERYQGVPILD
ncbi:hypothetical protein HY485_01910 [Candidatus Woesearchaeota archaeon]|nr:hypothetical protein [Candidatus Woesearchaeota archaeon]